MSQPTILSVYKQSFPSVLRQCVSPLSNIIILSLLSSLNNKEILSSFARVNTFLLPISCFFSVLVISLTSKVANFNSQKDYKSLSSLLHTILFSCFLLGFSLSLFFLLLSSHVLHDSTSQSYALVHFRIRSLLFPLTLLNASCSGILQGVSKFNTILLIQIVNTTITAIFGFIFINILKFELTFLAVLICFSTIVSLILNLYFINKFLPTVFLYFSTSSFFSLSMISSFFSFAKSSSSLIWRAGLIDLIYFLIGYLIGKKSFDYLAVYYVFLNHWIFWCNVFDGFSPIFLILMTKSRDSLKNMRNVLKLALKVSIITCIFALFFVFLINYLVYSSLSLTYSDLSISFPFFLSLVFSLSLVINFLCFVFEFFLFSFELYDKAVRGLFFGFICIFIPFIGFSFFINSYFISIFAFLALTFVNLVRLIFNFKYLVKFFESFKFDFDGTLNENVEDVV
ncbi:hypothetical protein RCL1_007008 [Eukaryota sp. TZLM3-RCL]